MEVAINQVPERAVSLGELLIIGLSFYICFKLTVAVCAGLVSLFVGSVTGVVSVLLYDRYEPLSRLPAQKWWQRWILVPSSQVCVFSIACALAASAMYLTWHISLSLFEDFALDVCKEMFTAKR